MRRILAAATQRSCLFPLSLLGGASQARGAHDGFVGQRSNKWSCPSCGVRNFNRQRCFGCSLPRAEQNDDRFEVFQDSRPQRYSSDEPVEGIAVRSVAEEFSTPKEMKKGDWLCRKCSAHNFAFRHHCIDCGNARPAFRTAGPSTSPRESRSQTATSQAEAGDAAAGDLRATTTEPRTNDEITLTDRQKFLFAEFLSSGLAPPKVGDWRCCACKFVNFASRTTCKVCANESSTKGNASFNEADISDLILLRKKKSRSGSRSGSRPAPSSNSKSDWICSRCQYINFSKRDRCNKCGTNKHAPAPDSPSGEATPQQNRPQDPAEEGIESMLSEMLDSAKCT